MAKREHDKDPVQAAELRAKITAYVNGLTRRCSSAELVAQFTDEAKAVGYKPTTMYWLLDSMAKHGLISQATFDGKKWYSGKAMEQAAKAVEVPVKMVDKPALSTTMLLDVVQSTGRVRITIGGITLEIGVAKN